jgi:hypothetical protein
VRASAAARLDLTTTKLRQTLTAIEIKAGQPTAARLLRHLQLISLGMRFTPDFKAQ